MTEKALSGRVGPPIGAGRMGWSHVVTKYGTGVLHAFRDRQPRSLCGMVYFQPHPSPKSLCQAPCRTCEKILNALMLPSISFAPLPE